MAVFELGRHEVGRLTYKIEGGTGFIRFQKSNGGSPVLLSGYHDSYVMSQTSDRGKLSEFIGSVDIEMNGIQQDVKHIGAK